jgi:hypothetical protein
VNLAAPGDSRLSIKGRMRREEGEKSSSGKYRNGEEELSSPWENAVIRTRIKSGQALTIWLVERGVRPERRVFSPLST